MSTPTRRSSYKRYLKDPSSPLPRSTRHRWASSEQQQPAASSSEIASSTDVEPENETAITHEDTDQVHSISNTEVVHNGTPPSQIGDNSSHSSSDHHVEVHDYNDISTNHDNNGETEQPALDPVQTNALSASAEDTIQSVNSNEHPNFTPLAPSSTQDQTNRNQLHVDDSPIYEGSEVSRSQVLALTLAFIIRHQVSGLGLQDLLDLLNIIAPGCVPVSKFHFNKYFNAHDRNIEFHFYCQYCASLLVHENNGYLCNDCEETFVKNELVKAGNYFLTLPISVQLTDLFANHNLGGYLQKQNSEKFEGLSDICDGKIFTENPSLKEFLSDQDNISLSFSTDGVPIFKSSKFSIWPLFCTINEVSYEKRSEFVMLHSLWFGPDKPRMDVYFKPFLREMEVLETDGVEWVGIDGSVHCTKCTAIMCVCDTIARPMVQN